MVRPHLVNCVSANVATLCRFLHVMSLKSDTSTTLNHGAHGNFEIFRTHDVRFLPQPRFPCHEIQVFSPDASLWVAPLHSFDVDVVFPTAGDDGG